MSTPPPRPVPAEPAPLWRGSATCRKIDAADFFSPSHLERKEERELRESAARRLCRQCPVQQACLDYALEVQERHGILGGLNELERRRVLRKRSADEQTRTA